MVVSTTGLGPGAVFTRIFTSLDELEDELASASTSASIGENEDAHAYARSLLERSVPGVSGAVYHFSDSAIVAFENHR